MCDRLTCVTSENIVKTVCFSKQSESRLTGENNVKTVCLSKQSESRLTCVTG